MKYLVLLISILSIASPAQADSENAIAGIGSVTCAEWMTGREFNNERVNELMESWLSGYLSGLNVQRTLIRGDQNMVIHPSSYTLHYYIEQSCKEKPLDRVFVIVVKLYKMLEKQQGLDSKK